MQKKIFIKWLIFVLTIILLMIAILIIIYIYNSNKEKKLPEPIKQDIEQDITIPDYSKDLSDQTKLPELDIKPTRKFAGFNILDTTQLIINLDDLQTGGPGKDGIPAISNPKFVSINDTKINDEVLGIFIDIDNEQRFYPYTILVWHEIVNDSINETYFTVTFCPLCGSAIVYNRIISKELLDFGVSGFLFESNMVMYDRQTESFWSQARGESIVGKYANTKLEILPMQLISFKELKRKYPDTKILSDETGYNRNYEFYPYSNYENNEDLYFPVSIKDKRLPAKEIMYIIPYEDTSIALQQIKLEKSKKQTFQIDNTTIEVRRIGEEIITQADGKKIPGYYEMWFSWAIHHKDDGIVWLIE